MRRTTATLLTLFVLMGVFVPLALAVAAPSPHACCVRKAHSSCHSSESVNPALQGRSCCEMPVRGAITLTHAAFTQTAQVTARSDEGPLSAAHLQPAIPRANCFALFSPRAPPILDLL